MRVFSRAAWGRAFVSRRLGGSLALPMDLARPMGRALPAVIALFMVAGPAARGGEWIDDPEPGRWNKAFEEFERWDAKNRAAEHPLLFVGSSSIVNWSTGDDFLDKPVVNRGFGGSHMSDLNHWFVHAVQKYDPRVIVVYTGDNDIAAGKPAEQVADDYREFFERVRENFADTRVLVLSIKPSASRWKFWPEMKKANELIEAECRKKRGVRFVDLATSMLGADGQPRAELYVDDKLHLSGRGYYEWAFTLRSIIDEVWRETETAAAASQPAGEP